MKTIITGTKNINDYHLVLESITESKFDITEVVVGDLIGVGKLATEWADINNLDVRIFVADYKKYEHSANLKRNRQMLAYSEAAIIIWDGESRDMRHLINDVKRIRAMKLFVKTVKAFHSPNPKDVN